MGSEKSSEIAPGIFWVGVEDLRGREKAQLQKALVPEES